jgi:hypothetical protein
MDEYERVPEDGEQELEATIKALAERREAAREGSAEHRMVMRQLKGLRCSKLAEEILDGANSGGALAYVTSPTCPAAMRCSSASVSCRIACRCWCSRCFTLRHSSGAALRKAQMVALVSTPS